MKTAPVALFVYNRPWHTRQTVEALAENALAKDTDLYIYSDAPGNPGQVDNVAKVREYLDSVGGFRNVKVIERAENTGLAGNIIFGVSEVLGTHKRAIVLEDDIVTSAAFLTFMNRALDYYESNMKIWHISGWNYPIDPAGLDDTFFYRAMNCWGWATWENRWRHFEKNPDALIKSFSSTDIAKFDLEDTGVFWKQVLDNANGTINTWAIFWYASIFRHDSLCLNPTVSYVRNIGHDGSGENCINSLSDTGIGLNERVPEFSDDAVESETAVTRIREYYRTVCNRRYPRLINKARSYAKSFFR